MNDPVPKLHLTADFIAECRKYDYDSNGKRGVSMEIKFKIPRVKLENLKTQECDSWNSDQINQWLQKTEGFALKHVQDEL